MFHGTLRDLTTQRRERPAVPLLTSMPQAIHSIGANTPEDKSVCVRLPLGNVSREADAETTPLAHAPRHEGLDRPLVDSYSREHNFNSAFENNTSEVNAVTVAKRLSTNAS